MSVAAVSTLHHVLGRVYAGGVLIGSLGGFYLALTIPGPLSHAAGLFTLCIAWVVTTGMALYAIRMRRIEQHRECMLRSYTVTFAFVTYRLVSYWLRRWVHVPESDLRMTSIRSWRGRVGRAAADRGTVDSASIHAQALPCGRQLETIATASRSPLRVGLFVGAHALSVWCPG